MRNKLQTLLHIVLPKGYDVHHIDKNRKNNVLENLIILPTGVHKHLHRNIKYNDNLLERKYLKRWLLENGYSQKVILKPVGRTNV